MNYIFTGENSDIKYETLNVLISNGREDLMDIFLNLNDDKILKDDIEELESIMAKNGRIDILKFIKKSLNKK